ncbi:Mg2+ transporter protein, CorA-like [Oceanicola granulosus HTCC2516]|uniref:Mg2+ transporter protein, CorA-like n=1 Tax=Oceanicola granulosus (strain ATCC BAA-861 / DSM 15982 / KCTC 12143 / HTCC2516) TaxID=314256 RepID=Q2CAI4_OCEGH|nr:zinc transporter ZntB [Oceanicola granulosus]EAR49690.1 Mg2+ transporter protein, CorA-like [Oceanicola granulosus HTCC2516]
MPDCIQFAYALARDDTTSLESSDEIAAALAAPEPCWVHMRFDHPETEPWIDANLAYLPETARDALLENQTRPRASVIGDGLLVILRGVNTNPGDEPEDMVAIRLWVEAGRVVSIGRRPLASVEELAARVAAGDGPRRAGALLAALIEGLNRRIDDYLADLDDQGDVLEERVLREPDRPLRNSVTDIRGELVDVRRFLIPQREAAHTLSRARAAVLQEDDADRLAESHERLVRAVEETESLRERMVVVSDELNTALSDRLNRNLYLLSMISAIFLPLGVLTGLMGVNLAGMPGAAWPPAFWVFTGLLGAIVVVQVLVLRALRWV